MRVFWAFFILISFIVINLYFFDSRGLYYVGESKQDRAIRQRIIDSSIRSHGGLCPCPYSVDWKGNKCGRNSAYKKNRGVNAPICYPADIPDSMMLKYRRKR